MHDPKTTARWQRAHAVHRPWRGHNRHTVAGDRPRRHGAQPRAHGSLCREHGMRLRPHAKMHKSAELARLQMDHGAVGVCVQKTDEALALAHAGVRDIYISNEVIAPAKLQRLAQAVRDLPTKFSIAVDSVSGVTLLAQRLAHGRRGGTRPRGRVRRNRCGARSLRRGARRPGGGAGASDRSPPHSCALPGCRPTTVARNTAARPPSAPRPWQRRPALCKPPGRPCRPTGSTSPWSPVRAQAPFHWRPAAACGASCRRALTCSWTRTTPAMKRAHWHRCLNTRCS